MSAIGAVIENFEAAKKAESEQNYLRAARYYRLCALYYENGELPIYDSRVVDYGRSAPSHYESCRSKLTPKAQRMLYKEETEYIKGKDWIEFVCEDFERIMKEQDVPSPNQTKKQSGGCLPLLLICVCLLPGIGFAHAGMYDRFLQNMVNYRAMLFVIGVFHIVLYGIFKYHKIKYVKSYRSKIYRTIRNICEFKALKYILAWVSCTLLLGTYLEL